MEIGNISEFIKHLLVLFLHLLYRCKGRVLYKVNYNIYCPSINLEWVVCSMFNASSHSLPCHLLYRVFVTVLRSY